MKQIGHFTKISSTAVLGGEVYGTQKKSVSDCVCIVPCCGFQLLLLLLLNAAGPLGGCRGGVARSVNAAQRARYATARAY